jgi:hypothetical protein
LRSSHVAIASKISAKSVWLTRTCTTRIAAPH